MDAAPVQTCPMLHAQQESQQPLHVLLHFSDTLHRAYSSPQHCCSSLGSSVGSETGSDGGSPLGPKGGGTLKTCAICLEDYK